MALGSSARVPISRRMVAFDSVNSDDVLPLVWASLLTVLVAGPWLAPGYVFGTDWPGPRRFDYPIGVPSWAPISALLAVASSLFGGEVAAKLFIFAFIFAAGLFAYRAVPVGGFVARAGASTIYVLNPFVYGRIHYGQWFVLAGYALLPWVAIRLRELLLHPGVKPGLLLALCLTVIGILSTHLFLVSGVLFTTLLVTHIIAATKQLDYLRRIGPSLLVAGVATLIASSYWMVPLLFGRGQIANTVASISSGDLK